MRSLLRTFFLGLICLLLVASSDPAVNAYGRSGRSLAAAQSSSVVTVNPSVYQTPVYAGDLGVPSSSNTGHEATTSTAFHYGPTSQAKSCQWSAFQPVSGQITRITLKFDWSTSGFVNMGVTSGSGSASASFNILYSTNNGSNWTNAISAGESISGENGLFIPFDGSGSFSVDLPANTPINQIAVLDRLSASAWINGDGFAEATVDATISNIRLEVETVNCIANVPGDRWRGEYFNNQTLSGSPTMVRDDSAVGTDFLNLNFGGGSPHSLCAPAVDNFSARWTRTVNFAAGTYRFTAAVDNGVRLYVDGQLKIDQWGNLPPNTYTADVFISEGNHEIRLEFLEYIGGASVSLSWAVVCHANVAADRWRGEYFNNQTLSGSPTMVRDDSTVGTDFLNLNFGGGSPHSLCAPAVDNFSARWTRTVSFAAGTYRFTAAVDNGVRLYVDGQLKIDQWGNLPPNTYTAEVALSVAPHEIRVEFVEYGGGASASLFWGDANCLANVPANRWRGEYYNNTTLTGFPRMVRDEGAVFLNLDFGLGSPSAACGLGVDNFSARWTRTVNFPASAYRFSVTGDDGVRLYVDGQLKIDKWFSQGATTYTADVTLSAGNHEVKLEYFESGGPGIALLSWADVTGVNCLPNAPLPLISSVPQTGGRETIASTAPSQAPRRCDPKIVTAPRAPGSD